MNAAQYSILMVLDGRPAIKTKGIGRVTEKQMAFAKSIGVASEIALENLITLAQE